MIDKEKAMKSSGVGRRIVDGLQQFTDALQNGEFIPDEFTCRTVVLKLEPTDYDPELVKLTRKKLGASQAIFAQFLGVTTSCVQAWEIGENTPNDMACRFMDEIRHNPDHWLSRLKELVVPKECV